MQSAIIAQVALTALSLPWLSGCHWIARACWVLSLVAGLMAVYCSGSQQIEFGRLSNAEEVRAWMRSGKTSPRDIVNNLSEQEAREELHRVERFLYSRNAAAHLFVSGEAFNKKARLGPVNFAPRPGAVIAVSGPRFLLAMSLNSFLLALGVYLFCLWRRDLDPNSAADDARNVFIVFITGLSASIIVFFISSGGFGLYGGSKWEWPVTLIALSYMRFARSALSTRIDEPLARPQTGPTPWRPDLFPPVSGIIPLSVQNDPLAKTAQFLAANYTKDGVWVGPSGSKMPRDSSMQMPAQTYEKAPDLEKGDAPTPPRTSSFITPETRRALAMSKEASATVTAIPSPAPSPRHESNQVVRDVSKDPTPTREQRTASG